MANTDNFSFNFNNQHYYQVTDTNYQSWADAVNNASELGGYLVSIDDETESSLLQQSLNSEGKYWVGGEEGNVFGGAIGESFIASPDDNLSLPGIIEYDSAFDYYTSADYLDSAISTLLPDSLSYLWDTVSIEQPAENQYELSWQDEINLTELFDVDSFLPDVNIDSPTFSITTGDSGNSYGFAGEITVAGETFNIDTSFTLEDIGGVSSFSWDNISLPSVSLDSVAGLLGDAAGLDDLFNGVSPTVNINITDDGAEVSLPGTIGLTQLFGASNFLPEFNLTDSSFKIATADDTTTYEFASDITVASETFGLSSSFTQEEDSDGNREFSWSEIEISEFDLDSITGLLGSNSSAVDNFFSNKLPSLPDVTVTISEDEEVELVLPGEIDLSNKLGLNSVVPGLNLSITDTTFAIASADNSTTYKLAGDIAIAGETFDVSTSFTSEEVNGVSELSWEDIAIPSVSLDSVTSLLGDTFAGLDSFFSNASGTIDISIDEDGAELVWNDDISLTQLFNLGGSFPTLAVGTPTFAIALEDNTTTYEFSGDVTIASETFGLSSSFTQEEDSDGNSEFSWSEIEISEFNLDNITGLLGNSFSAVDNFFSNKLSSLPSVTVTISEDEIELALTDEINVSNLLNLNSFLPGLNLSIADPTFAVSTAEDSTTYKLAGNFLVSDEIFSLSTSFTSKEGDSSQLEWQDISLPDFSLSSLTSLMGGAFTPVNDVFGDALPDIDITITDDELGFGSAINFASSSNKYLKWINKNLDLDTLDVDFIYDTDGAISLDAGVTGEFELVSNKDLDATLTDVDLSFDVNYSGSTWEASLALDAVARLDIKDSDNTFLDLSGGISFAAGSGGFEAEGYFALDAGQAGWDNPFGLPDSSIHSFGLGLGIGVAGLDSFGIRGDLQFGEYDFDAAFQVDLTNPDEFALAATLNEPISVLDLLAGPAASYALGQAANNVGFIDDAKDIMNEVLDVNVVSTDSDGDGELDPLIYIVPEDTEVAGKLYEQGFSVNAAVSAWGKDASLYFNANSETGEISGGLEIDKINIDVNDTTILKIEGSDFADDNGKGTIIGGTVTEADKYIDQSNNGTLVGDATVDGEGNNGTVIDGTITDGIFELDGINDYVRIADNADFDSITQEITVETWIKVDRFDRTWQSIVTKGDNSWRVHRFKNTNQLNFAINGLGNITGSSNVNDGKWHHVAAVYNGSQMRLYVDGQLDAQRNTTGTIPISDYDVLIGENDQRRGRYFEGQIDDVRIWNQGRTEAEIIANYQSTLNGNEAGLVAYWNFEEESVEGNIVQDVTANSVLNLDGSSDRVNVISDRLLDIDSTFTLEAWINPDHDDNGIHGFIGSQGNGGQERTPGMWVFNQTGIHFGFGDGSSWNHQSANNVLTPNSWNHVATTFDGITYTLYVNGEAVHSTDAFAGKTPYASNQLTLGEVGGYSFQGEMDEVRVWDISRSAAEISDNYQNSLSGEEAGLVAYWNFDNESVEGNTIQDVAKNGIEFVNSAPDGVLQLDGIDDYVDVTGDTTLNLSKKGTFTLETWINPNHDDNGYHGFIGSQGNGGQERTPGMWVVNQTGIHFGFGDGTSWNHQTANNVLTPNSWNHVATAFDGRTYTLYVNGEAVHSTNNFAGKTPYGSDSLTIGKVAGTSFQGEMDEVRVWDLARSASQIKNYYNQTLTGEERGLVGYWNFDGDSVNGNKVNDLAAGDDNLNLDFKLSDIDSYLRGDGKITFLGESIDVYVDASSSGLEFAMATDNGILTTDLAIVLDKSGFAASGSVDLDINADINLPFGLGKISLVDLEVNTDASISVDAQGFASSFGGSVTVNGKSISFSIEIDVAFSSVEDLYNKLEAKIIQEIKDSAKDIFSDVSEWANAIANGTVEFAGDVANVAVGAYNATEEAFIDAAETLGQTAEDITAGLSNTYNATKDDITGFLNDAGYTTEAIADALIGEFDATAGDIAQSFNSIGSTASNVATILDSKFTLTANEMASALESAFNVGTNSMADILKDIGYEINSIIGSLKSVYGATVTPLVGALKYADYTIDQIANGAVSSSARWFTTGLKNAGYTVDQIASAFKGAGKSVDFITSGMQQAYGHTADTIARTLSKAGYNVKEVGNALDKAFNLTKTPMASALKNAGFNLDDVGKFLKQELGYSKSAVKNALKNAGFSGVNKWADKLWNSIKFW